MGKGLNPTRGGWHIGYAAGTGVLTFIDLVAHLILREVAKQGGPDVLNDFYQKRLYGSTDEVIPRLPEDFCFQLNTSFLEPGEAIGLELINAL